MAVCRLNTPTCADSLPDGSVDSTRQRAQTAESTPDVLRARAHLPYTATCADHNVSHAMAQMAAAYTQNKKMACEQNLDLRCVWISDPGTLGAGAKTRLESRIKNFTPQCIC